MAIHPPLIHIDLFAGIGGNSLAFDTVFHEQKNKHIFCEIEPFPRAVLRKHWPDSQITGDIRAFTSDTYKLGCVHEWPKEFSTKREYKAFCESLSNIYPPFILTGGFPCQPFSQAGQRKGTADDRHLWPEMLRVIRLTQPQWVIAENVRGLLTIGGGLVFEQVCSDLEGAGYEVQPLIIPACAVDAPHRRDRIWFVAHRRGERRQQKPGRPSGDESSNEGRAAQDDHLPTGDDKSRRNASHTKDHRGDGRSEAERRGEPSLSQREQVRHQPSGEDTRPDWTADWHEIAAQLCRMDDGLPATLDGAKISASAHRKGRLKALGNAIVPQVAMEIMQAIKQTL
jgi:DNA (cytosine-5)-methyltransferase 1